VSTQLKKQDSGAFKPIVRRNSVVEKPGELIDYKVN